MVALDTVKYVCSPPHFGTTTSSRGSSFKHQGTKAYPLPLKLPLPPLYPYNLPLTLAKPPAYLPSALHWWAR